MAHKKHLLCQTALSTPLVFISLSTVMAADLVVDPAPETAPVQLPAVSQINGKLELLGGGTNRGIDAFIPFTPFAVDDDFKGAFLGKGSVTFPIGHQFGFQADGILGSVQSETYWQGAGHLFWRDPSVGLIGGYAAYSGWDSVEGYHVGIEGEAYLNQFTLSGIVGAAGGDIDNGLFTIADLSFYATDDVSLMIGHRYDREVGHAVTGGIEYQFHKTGGVGLSLYADARVGEEDYRSIFGGMKLYFGEDKSLVRRHREDDPLNRDFIQTHVGCTKKSTPLLVDGILDAALEADQAAAISPDSVLPIGSNRACNGKSNGRVFAR